MQRLQTQLRSREQNIETLKDEINASKYSEKDFRSVSTLIYSLVILQKRRKALLALTQSLLAVTVIKNILALKRKRTKIFSINIAGLII